MLTALAVSTSILVLAVSQLQAAELKMDPSHPCFAIKKACEEAGFKPGKVKDGTSLWKDCVDHLVKGETSVPGATLKLPVVEPKTIEACTAMHQANGHAKGQVK